MKQTAILLLLAFLLFGCESETPSGSTNNNSNDTGTVIGFTKTLTIFSGYNADQSGTKITLEGTSFSTLTDSAGRWVLRGIPSGSYSGILTRDGYITKTIYNVQVFPRGINYYENNNNNSSNIYPTPDFLESGEVVLRPFEDYEEYSYHDSTYIDSQGDTRHVIVTVTTRYPLGRTTFTAKVRMSKVTSDTNSASISGSLYVYFSKSKDVDPFQKKNGLIERGVTGNIVYFYEEQDTPYDFYIFRRDLLKNGFKSGDTIYSSVYASPDYTFGYQYNPYDPSYISYYLSSHHSPVYSFVLP